MTPERMDLKLQELLAILDRAAPALSALDVERLRSAMDTLAWLTGELQRKDTSLTRLRQYLFGSKTESMSRVVSGSVAEPGGAGKGSHKAARRPHKGHGRHGAAEYLGAERMHVSHTALAPRNA